MLQPGCTKKAPKKSKTQIEKFYRFLRIVLKSKKKLRFFDKILPIKMTRKEHFFAKKKPQNLLGI